MKRRLAVAGAALAGAVAGGTLMLSLPTAGQTPSTDAGSGSAKSTASARNVTKAAVPTLLAWTPGGLPEGFGEAARRIPGVRAVAEVASDLIWIDSWNSGGEKWTGPGAGLRVPMEVAAVDPEQYSAFVPPAERARLLALAENRILLSGTGAQLRGILNRGMLRTGDDQLEAYGLLDDELVGAHEGVVSKQTGMSLGITTPRYLLISLTDSASRRRVEAQLETLVPAGTRMRIRAPDETPVFRHGDAVLPPAKLKEIFGEFAAAPEPDGTLTIDPRWIESHISTAKVPLLGTVSCHRLILPQLTAALEEIERRGLGSLVRTEDFGGCFSGRFLNQDRSAGLSHHSWGVALDLNVSDNPFGAEPALDQRLVEILERWGFTWGGRWLVPDGMHFEFLSWPLGPKG